MFSCEPVLLVSCSQMPRHSQQDRTFSWKHWNGPYSFFPLFLNASSEKQDADTEEGPTLPSGSVLPMSTFSFWREYALSLCQLSFHESQPRLLPIAGSRTIPSLCTDTALWVCCQSQLCFFLHIFVCSRRHKIL